MNAPRKRRPRVDGDRYYTPKWMAEQMARLVVPAAFEGASGWLGPLGRRPRLVLEPSCGLGALSTAYRKFDGAAVIETVDPDPRSVAAEKRTLEYYATMFQRDAERRPFDLGIMNPPYGLAIEHIGITLDLCDRVVALLRAGFLSSQKRAGFFEEHPPCGVFIIPNRPSFDFPADYLAKYPVEEFGPIGSDSADYVWVAWDQTNPAPVTHLHWLPTVDIGSRRD